MLQASRHSSWQQLYLLLGIVIETAARGRHSISSEAVPSIATQLAARFTPILHNPLHFLYSKANEFLSTRPEWDVEKLPSHWMHRIFLHPPDDEKMFDQDVLWLLETFLEGLRTPLVSRALGLL